MKTLKLSFTGIVAFCLAISSIAIVVAAKLHNPSEQQIDFQDGTIITAAIVHGLPSPVQSDPMPMLLQVTVKSMVENKLHPEILGCYLLSTVISDLPTSSSFIRASKISCMAASGKFIEQDIYANAVSSNGNVVGVTDSLTPGAEIQLVLSKGIFIPKQI